MEQTAFHDYVKVCELTGYAYNRALLPAFASSSMNIYPYQIAAALFVLRSPYTKGCILCDEGSLGKTYEALLVAAQKWCEGKGRLLLILPTNLIRQWADTLENAFALPYFFWNSGDALPDEDGLVMTTYDFAASHAGIIGGQSWDLVIFDEADVLSKPQNKTVAALKAVTEGSFKLLLTPTPITMSIMDIYGLIHFIDDSILPDADEFYKRYFRKPENYHELTCWVSRFAFRTLKSQVTDYVNFTSRLPVTLTCDLTPAEKTLYDKVAAYLARPEKVAYPQMDRYDLTLMFYHTLSSSAQAFGNVLKGVIARLETGGEKAQLEDMLACIPGCRQGGKVQTLLSALKKCFARLVHLKSPQKAIVFVNNLATLDVLQNLLARKGYHIITNARPDYAERFRKEKTAILITTDAAAKGLDMEFCPLVINYDMRYNAMELEQRISRCHRQGQQSDVLVINLLCRENAADVRILELINKRVLQFHNIFGMSDEILGNFDMPIEEIISQIRTPDQVKAAFEENLAAHRQNNRQLVSSAEDMLFTTFTKAVAEKVCIVPQYIEEQTAILQEELWPVVRAYFSERKDYAINEQSRTVTLLGDTPPTLFYYWTGSRNKPYVGRKCYSMDKNFKPAAGRITLASVLVKGIFSEIACTDSGEITVDADIAPCEIGFYRVGIFANRKEVASHEIFVGKTAAGKVLDNRQCSEIMQLPVLACLENGNPTSHWLRNSTGNNERHALDSIVPLDELVEAYRLNSNPAACEEIEQIKRRATRKKAELESALVRFRIEAKAAQQEMESESGDRLHQLATAKRLKVLEKQMRCKEQDLFVEKMQVKIAAEDEIAALTAKEHYTVRLQRQFTVKVSGGKSCVNSMGKASI